MKIIFTIVAAAAALLCSCKQNSVPQPVKLADYLWEITVDDYTSDVPNYLEKDLGTEFSCTAVRNGNYYIANRTLWVTIREDYENIYKFSL